MVEVHLVALARLQTSPLDWESNWQIGGNKFPADGVHPFMSGTELFA